jgi:hypothetical protein
VTLALLVHHHLQMAMQHTKDLTSKPAESIFALLSELAKPANSYSGKAKTMNAEQRTPQQVLQDVLAKEIAQQKKWHRANFVLYVIAASITIIGSICAAIVGGFEHAKYSAILAGSAALFATAEKALRFQDRYKFHLKTVSQFESAKLSLDLGNDVNEVSHKVQHIIENYADGLPISDHIHQVPPES